MWRSENLYKRGFLLRIYTVYTVSSIKHDWFTYKLFRPSGVSSSNGSCSILKFKFSKKSKINFWTFLFPWVPATRGTSKGFKRLWLPATVKFDKWTEEPFPSVEICFSWDTLEVDRNCERTCLAEQKRDKESRRRRTRGRCICAKKWCKEKSLEKDVSKIDYLYIIKNQFILYCEM